MRACARWALFAALLVTAMAKFVDLPTPGTLLGPWGGGIAACAELALAAFLLRASYVSLVCRIVQWASIVGMVIALYWGGECGCAGGRIHLGSRGHAILCCAIGLLACACQGRGLRWSRSARGAIGAGPVEPASR